jgi:hypothetical protein
MIAFPLALLVLIYARLFTGFTRSPIMPVTNTHDTTEPTELMMLDAEQRPEGNIVNTSDNHILDTDEVQTYQVHVSVSAARRPNGHHAIRVIVPENVTLTAAQSHELSVDLGIAADYIAAIRRDAGYGS